MSTAEYGNTMSNIEPTNTTEQMKAFSQFDSSVQLHGKAKQIHTANMDEIIRFKAIMDKLMAIETDIHMIKKHFNIVSIIGNS